MPFISRGAARKRPEAVAPATAGVDCGPRPDALAGCRFMSRLVGHLRLVFVLAVAVQDQDCAVDG
jgi:hypothetical protein